MPWCRPSGASVLPAVRGVVFACPHPVGRACIVYMRVLLMLFPWLCLACAGGASSDGGGDSPMDAPVDSSPVDTAPPTDASVVGVTTRTWIDSTRGIPANGDAGARSSRALVTELWYPALGVAGEPEIRDASASHVGAPFPLVLFVHGSSGTRRSSPFLAQALAAAGYVVAAADFPLTTIETPGGPTEFHVDDQVGDLRFIADQVAAASASASDVLSGLVDASRYVVVGHSTGGTVALLAAFAPDIHDGRVAGSVALAPCACFFGNAFYLTRAMPLLVISGTDDRFVPITTNSERAYGLAGAPKDMVTLVGGNHLYFTQYRISDDALMPTQTTSTSPVVSALVRYGSNPCEPVPPPISDPLMAFDVQHRHTVEWTVAFVEAILRGRGAAMVALRGRSEPDLRVQHVP